MHTGNQSTKVKRVFGVVIAVAPLAGLATLAVIPLRLTARAAAGTYWPERPPGRTL